MVPTNLVPKYRTNQSEFFSESGQARWTVQVRGTGLNNNAAPMIYVNEVNRLSTYGRGLTLVIFNTSMVPQSTTVYDVYGDDAARTNLATALDNIRANNSIFALVSYDAIGTNATLNTAMNNIGSQLWSQKFGSIGQDRYPYAAIGRGNIGILSEQMWSPAGGAPYAQFTFTIEDINSMGSCGYGPVWSRSQVFSGNGYPFVMSPDLRTFLKVGTASTTAAITKQVRLTVDVKVDKAARDAGVSADPYIWYSTSAGSWQGAVAASSNSIEYEKLELNLDIPSNATEVYVGVYHMPSNITTGLAYAKNLQVQCVGTDSVPTTARSKMGPYVITSRNLLETPQSMYPGSADRYWNLWNSDQNLYRNVATYTNSLTGPGTANETVQWFDYNLTDQQQKFIHWKTSTDASGENMSYMGPFIDVDHTKMYYGCVWYYNFFKTSGRNYVGTNGRNSSNVDIALRDHTGSYAAGTNPYFVYPTAANIEKNKWNIADCWFLPSTFTQAEATDFYNKYWQKTFGYYNNRLPNDGNCQVVWMDSSVGKVLLRFLDYYNGTDTSKTWWALPMIVEVSPMAINNFEISSLKFEEVAFMDNGIFA